MEKDLQEHFPVGLDGRMRDRNGEIRHKRRDTLVSNLRAEYGANFAPGFRDDDTLETVLEKTGIESLHKLVNGN